MRTKSAIVFACGLAMFTVVQAQVQQQQPPPPATGAQVGSILVAQYTEQDSSRRTDLVEVFLFAGR